ncbi:peptidoglycan-binding domain-containing protein [Streptomyces sp. NPDC007808]|uniref:peptidoglycan-binding domain-containing protein n=1 Tax=Streptomyces sp. NPDC007808 TaxID=3364779 RepID=UPI0036878514
MATHTHRPRLASALTAAVMSAAVGATPALGASPASAAVSDGYVSGGGSFNNDWGDEGPVSTSAYSRSNAACLWQKILWAEGLLKESRISGNFSSETRVATKKLQSRWNITTTGKADPKTFNTAGKPGRLKYVSGSTASGRELTLKYQGGAHEFTVKRNDKGRYGFYADGAWRSAAYRSLSCR